MLSTFISGYFGSSMSAPYSSDASRAESHVSSLEDKVKYLESKMDSLLLLNQALLEIMVVKSIVTESELKEKITEIDLRDGVLDGKIWSAGNKCQKCNRAYNNRLNKCLYCGNINSSKTFLNAPP